MYFNKPLILIVFFLQISYTIHAQDALKADSGSVISIQNGSAIFVNSGVNLKNGSNLKNAGTITILKTGSGTADFTDNNISPYKYGIGTFIFQGSGTQTISSSNQFERIEVDNSGLNLATNIEAGTWYLKAGKINTGFSIAIATSYAESAIEIDSTNLNFSNSWINGTLRRFIIPAMVNNYWFPVGDAAKANLIEMDSLTINPIAGISYVTASFAPKPGTDAGLNVSENGTPYSSINNNGVWYLIPDANPTSGKYDLKLYFNGFTGLTDNSFGILRRQDASTNAADWIIPTGSLLPAVSGLGRTVAGGYARRNNISTFSQYSIGMASGALPIQLLNFNGVKKDKSVLLQWATANEINVSHFELFKGSQPFSMQFLDKRLATGTAGNKNYEYTDFKPLKGLNYYQLKMVDKNNSYTLSQIVKINFDGISTLSVYPNPVTNRILFVNYPGGKVKEAKLIATDTKQIACNFELQTNNQLKISVPAGVAKGTYILQLVSEDGKTSNIKIVVQ